MGFTHPACRRAQGVDGFLSVFHYNPALKNIIKQSKYRLATEVYDELLTIVPLEFLYKLLFFRKLSSALELQSIPLHKNRLRQRGFNQADVWRDFLGGYLQQAVKVSHLVRVKETRAQAQLGSRVERFTNMRGAFSPTPSEAVRGKSIILCDDVVTTGSTVKEACRILKKEGAINVYVFALGRG